MNIVPINFNPTINVPTMPAQSNANGSVPFKAMFEDAVSNLENLNAIKNQDAIDLSLGNVDDLGQIQINSEKADTALQLLVQMRNKILDGYNEIMRMNI